MPLFWRYLEGLSLALKALLPSKPPLWLRLNRQVALYLQLAVPVSRNCFAPKGDDWVFLNIEEIRTLQVRVTCWLQRGDGVGINRDIHCRCSEILGIVDDCAFY